MKYQPKIVVFDLEGTLLEGPRTLKRIFLKMNLKRELEDLKKQFEVKVLNKNIDDLKFFDYASLTLEYLKILKEKKFNIEILREIENDTRFTKNASLTVNILKSEGCKVGLITGGIDNIAIIAKKSLGLDFAASHCSLIFSSEGFLESWKLKPYDFLGKATLLKKIAKSYGTDMSKVAYIGNDINDFFALSEVGIPIVFNPKNEAIEKIAKIVIKQDDISEVLRFI